MEQSIRKFSILFALLLLCACRHWEPFTYETYAPLKESLSFINDSICIYRHYDMYKRDSPCIIDTCNWRYIKMNYIGLNKKNGNRLDVFSPTISDSIEKDRLNFIYNICPRWYNISDDEFKQYADYKIPMYQDEAFHCEIPSFYRKFGYRYSISSDTVVIIDSCLVLPKMVRGSGMSFFFLASNKKSKQMRHELSRSVSKDDAYFCSWIMDSYEYINYKVNYKRKVEFDVNSILGKQFSYLADSCKKESVHFVNDSICMHVASKRQDVTSPYMPIAMDTCRYTTKNNLIAIDLYKDSHCDTLTYGKGILFYSKVYQDNKTKKYTHVVKPFIDENVKWENKSDSINMIMSTYFNVYVPINLFPCLEEH